MATGLPSNDVRALAVADDGTLWIGTAAGLVQRLPGGVLAVSGGLPSPAIRDVALEGHRLHVATDLGLAIGQPGAFTVVDLAAGLRSLDVRAVAVGNDGAVWAGTAQGVSRRAPEGGWTTVSAADGLASDDVRTIALAANGAAWVGTAVGVNVVTAAGGLSAPDFVGGGGVNPAVRTIHAGWSAARELATGGSSNREPTLALDQNQRPWLIWSQRAGAASSDESWSLRARIFDSVAGAWGVERELTSPPAGGRASDRMPAALPVAGGMRIYFSSDRNGGFGLWSAEVPTAGAVALTSLLDEPSSDVAPSPIMVGGAVWLLYRSDSETCRWRRWDRRHSRRAGCPACGCLTTARSAATPATSPSRRATS